MPGAQERSDQLAEPGARGRTAAASPDLARVTDRPERGSLADLQQRLQRLPPGHPSSPYDDDLRHKPPVVRLKDLELPLPGAERGAAATVNLAGAVSQEQAANHAPTASQAGTVSQEEAASHAPTANYEEAANHAPTASQAGTVSQEEAASHAPTANYEEAANPARTVSQEGRELADGAAAAVAPEAASRNGSTGRSTVAARFSTSARTAGAPGAAAADGASTADGATSERTGDDTASPAKAAAGKTTSDSGTAKSRAAQGGSAGNGTGTADQGQETDSGGPAARTGAPRSGRAAERQARPAQHFAERSAPSPPSGRKNDAPGPVPPGSWESNGRRLDPAQRRIAEDALARYRKAEGRNVFGTYGHSGLTSAMRRIEALLERGQLAPDTEAHALKPADRFRERLADLILRHPDKPAEELAVEVHDGVRYAFLFDTAHYAEATMQVHSRLKGQGFELEARRNCWENPEYKGINTRWRDPAHDLAFEVQFHTTSSWDVRQRAGALHQEITDPATPPTDLVRLRAALADMSAAIPAPPGCAAIPDFRKEGQ
jgi:hypothetical protein